LRDPKPTLPTRYQIPSVYVPDCETTAEITHR